MTTATAYGTAVIGVTGHLVEVRTTISPGPAAMTLAGLPDTVLREARDRVRAAVLNSGHDWPHAAISCRLEPAHLPKHGGRFDTTIAASILTAAGTVPAGALRGVVFIAELGLDGRLRPVRGVLPAVQAAAAGGFTTVVVAADNAAEAGLVAGVTVITAADLTEVTGWLRGSSSAATAATGAGVVPASPSGKSEVADQAEVPGQSQASYAAEICAAGGHHMSLLGPAGIPKALAAARVRALLPPLDHEAALEVTAIRSAAGLLSVDAPLVTGPLLCAPHRTVSRAMVTGDDRQPGVVSLAHRGVLFLDDAPDFSLDVLSALRRPLETGELIAASGGGEVRFPARFILVLGTCGCPCASMAGEAGCACSPAARRRYLGRLAGPLADRIDLKVAMELPRHGAAAGRPGPVPSGAGAAARVLAARARALRRLDGTPWQVNSDVPRRDLRRCWPPEPDAVPVLDQALDRGLLSERGAGKVLRVAWTLADLDARPRPGKDECATALALWLGTSQ